VEERAVEERAVEEHAVEGRTFLDTVSRSGQCETDINI